jgi:AcrR family transcriptional regulator
MSRLPASPPASARILALESVRERILQAARDLVAAKGWQGAQVALIAARAKVATGSVYGHFASKVELCERLLDRVSEREVQVLRDIVDGEGSARARLITMIRAFAGRAMKSPRLAYAMIAEPCEPEIDATRLEYRAAIAHEFARVVRDGVATGEFLEVDPALAASCVAGAFFEAMVVHLGPGAPRNARMAEAVAALCVRMVARAA